MVVTEKPLEAPVPPLVAGQQDREMLPQQPAEPTDKSNATSVKSKDIEQPASESAFHSLTIYFRCLFAADPTWLDITLIIGGSICAAAAGTPFPLMAILFGQLVDDLNDATCAAEAQTADPFAYASEINEKVLLMAIIAIAAFCLIYIYILAWGVISQRLAQRLRRANAGEVSSRLHGDITAVQAGTSEKVGIFISSISFFVTAFIIAYIKQAKLAGMLTAMIPAFMLMSLIGGAYFGKYTARMSTAIGTASSLAGECLRNISVVHAFGAGPRLEARFADLMVEARTAGIKKAVVAAIQAGLLYFIAYAGNALAFWQGSKMIAEARTNPNGTSMGDIYTVVLLLVDACVMLGGIAPILPLFGGASAAFLRLQNDIEAPSTLDATSDAGKILPAENPGSTGISFNNVSFSYPSRPTQPVLRNVNLTFPTGKYTAIVGLSGSGKSTIASLISRLYDPGEGSITYDGQDIRNINLRNLRSHMGFVQQEPTLLNSSILTNIALGLVNTTKPAHAHLKSFLNWNNLTELGNKGKDLSASAEALGPEAVEIVKLVHDAADQADAASFIERLESGYGTVAGPGGSLISGGQRQRIALAQALIRDPQILVLDEATAALDSASERRIQEAVERAAKHRTVISIAHRLSTIRKADNIVVMEAGQVVEQGSYAGLMAIEGGVFARMASLQSVGTVDRGEASSISGDSLDASTLKTDIFPSEKLDPADHILSKESSAKEAAEKGKEEDKEEEEPKTELDTKQPFFFVTKGLGRLVRPSLLWLVGAIIAAAIVGCTFSSAGVILGYTVGALNPCANTVERILDLGRFFAGMIFMLACIEFFANFVAWSSSASWPRRCFTLSAFSPSAPCLSRTSTGTSPRRPRSCSPSSPRTVRPSVARPSVQSSPLASNFFIAIILSPSSLDGRSPSFVSQHPLSRRRHHAAAHAARYEERQAGAFADATAVAVEAVHSIRTIAALSLEGEIMGSYTRLLRGPQKMIFRSSASTNIWLAMQHSMGTLIYCLSYWWGSQLIMRGEYSQTQFFIILIAMLVSAQLWGTMFSLAPEFSRARLAVSRILNVINLGSGRDLSKAQLKTLQTARESKTRDKTARSSDGADAEAANEVQLKQPFKGESRGAKVTFNNVGFTYPNRPDVPVLDGVSFTLQPGQFCGTISLDGQDLKPLPSSFRESIALVPQDPTLFDGTVRFNVGLGAAPGTEATDAEIEEACRLANIHDTIMALPDGYNSECGASAQRLSGGQRQRLAIARALVRKPRLLLLDESTSALDAASEAALQEGLERASRGTTVLAITHRLHTVQKADVILVVEGGKIVDQGRHAELMERRESYRINAMQQMLQ
ncbi:multidrug resistance protein [Verticillium alfalfae VaMs.102]|uniref:Multidrug resistance protein n=1 Tax=Verticillium alfalfae (strain VaMs.102 / ATCC MYA-4576 / FGSC 10136) TaxID=526221 RepID=C9SAF3_VERA1|nr:multidrug resistance protein [Verticillium alfalfae VaMs.102]EEY16321.1 multidrug resistance protein [Verticillium alfalfae VaMs.102]